MKLLSIGLLLFAVGCLEGTPQSLLDPGPAETSSAAVSTPAPSNEVAAAASTNGASPKRHDAPPALTVGSPAPALKVSRYLKGEPVEAFEPGKIYVVEFWATWCGPCITSMPHVTALQKQYPDVTFIGVSVWERNPSAPEAFLKIHGDKIDYRIACDEIPEGATANEGAMATTWLNAAEANGIPTAFVVDGQGRIANITHPMSLDESLPQIIAGKYDVDAAAKRHLGGLLESRHAAELNTRVQALLSAQPTDETLAAFDQLAADFPSRAPILQRLKFQKLLQTDGKSEQALAEGRKLIQSEFGKDPMFLKTRRIWKCRVCRKQFSVKMGTVFEDSPLGLDKWLPAIWLLANSLFYHYFNRSCNCIYLGT